MNIWGVLILFFAILLAVVGLFSSIMTIHAYFESHRLPRIKQRPATITVLFIVALFLISFILVPISLAIGNASTTQSSTTGNKNTPTPSPTITMTYTPTSTATSITQTSSPQEETDFSQGSQGWLNNTPQWTYNDTAKVLASDGSLPCCSAQTLQNAVLVAPYIIKSSDYAIEARIKITGLNSQHPYSQDQPPFFGLYARGDSANGQGYMAGIGWIYGTPTGAVGTNGPLSYLIALGTNPHFYNTVDTGAEKYKLDTAWHIYRFEIKGNAFVLKVDNTLVYSHIIHDTSFSFGPRVGLENYNCLLQIQSFTVYQL